MALHPECDSAIEDIVNEAIVSDTHDSPVEIELSNLNASDGIKNKIREEFKAVKDLLDFDKKAHEIAFAPSGCGHAVCWVCMGKAYQVSAQGLRKCPQCRKPWHK